ncbi:LacI family DNA-binding transcriptional regulator [Pseudoxanthomonas dokdonensis]|uniref:LacI family transcriptional regulator n=1 Tax=Pseudoxanthomonas dokdonensis TaxID=344882 RepID=A0A0R0CSU4_9GAMM|nr:LacI family DNA-binding transcriptional regulator [Pseudoxanthomonas dokdonensis]KRG67896.1 LacI family transcriptional regulator [Pseudoxanthomonas dokdonensis]
MPARIEDVAAAAGVSMKTVSRVFNREPNVRERTRQIVLQVAEELNYRPNPSARSLAGNRSYQVCLMYDNPSSNYVMEIIGGVLDACEGHRYGMMLRPLDYTSEDHVESAREMLAQYRPDGLVLTPPLTDDERLLEVLRDSGIPYASVSAQSHHASMGATLDERCAVAEMMAHVIALGHRRIAHITGHPAHGARAWRLDGYLDGLKQAGIEFDSTLVVEGEFSFESGVAGARQLLDGPSPPTAIFAANDDTACGVICEALERGLAIPGDLSVFGFDDTPMSRHVWPSLTTIRQPSREMGKVAAEQLLRFIREKVPGGIVRIPYELKLRRSTGRAPG